MSLSLPRTSRDPLLESRDSISTVRRTCGLQKSGSLSPPPPVELTTQATLRLSDTHTTRHNSHDTTDYHPCCMLRCITRGYRHTSTGLHAGCKQTRRRHIVVWCAAHPRSARDSRGFLPPSAPREGLCACTPPALQVVLLLVDLLSHRRLARHLACHVAYE